MLSDEKWADQILAQRQQKLNPVKRTWRDTWNERQMDIVMGVICTVAIIYLLYVGLHGYVDAYRNTAVATIADGKIVPLSNMLDTLSLQTEIQLDTVDVY